MAVVQPAYTLDFVWLPERQVAQTIRQNSLLPAQYRQRLLPTHHPVIRLEVSLWWPFRRGREESTTPGGGGQSLSESGSGGSL